MISRFSCILNYIGLQVIEIYRQCNWESELPLFEICGKTGTRELSQPANLFWST